MRYKIKIGSIILKIITHGTITQFFYVYITNRSFLVNSATVIIIHLI